MHAAPQLGPCRRPLLVRGGCGGDGGVGGDGAWIDVEPTPGAFTCNIGDMMARWTNGLYRATPHRVLRPATGARISIPFFFEPNYDAVIAPLPRCCEITGRSAMWPPVVYGDHLHAKTSSNFAPAAAP